MRTLGVLLAMVVGFVVWSILLVLLGSTALGKSGPVEHMLAWAPVIGTAAPISLYLFSKVDVVAGAWALALAPFLSILNFFLYVAFSHAPPVPIVGKLSLGLIVISTAWQLPWLYVLVQWLRSFRRALQEEKSPGQ